MSVHHSNKFIGAFRITCVNPSENHKEPHGRHCKRASDVPLREHDTVTKINAVLMLDRRLRRRAKIKSAFSKSIVFAGRSLCDVRQLTQSFYRYSVNTVHDDEQ